MSDTDQLVAPPQQGWWKSGDGLQRFVTDLVFAELSRLRPNGASLPPAPWPLSLRLDGDGVSCDSLELVAVASSLNEALHLHESGVEDYLLARRTLGDWIQIASAGLDAFSARLTFRTSGSTGVPKPCDHPLAHLAQEIEEQQRLFAPTTRRIVAAVPNHHIYGFLFTILLPQRLGGLPVLDARQRLPASLVRQLQPGDLVVGHPEFWRNLLTSVSTDLPAGVRGVTSTAPCPDEISRGVLAIGLEQLVQIYGSSETAGIGWRTSAESPYRLFSYWSRLEERLQRRLPEGGTAEIEWNDVLEWEDEHCFRISGRRDGAVQVGGINVFPERVRQVLCEHPAVADAAVRLMRPEEGSRLKAFIVPRRADADQAALRSALAAWIDARLTVPERPKSLVFGPALPRNPLGKAADWPLAGLTPSI